MGYSVELFINPDEAVEFICSLCDEVLKDPTMIEGSLHMFCTECIQGWMSSSTICPIDGTPIKNEFGSPIRAFMELYNRLQIRCSFDGCSQVFGIGSIYGHVKKLHLKSPQIVELSKQSTIMQTRLESEIEKGKKEAVEALRAKDKEIKQLQEEFAATLQLKEKEIHELKRTLQVCDLNSCTFEQFYINVKDDESKLDTLMHLYDQFSTTIFIVFCNQKETTEWLRSKMREKKPGHQISDFYIGMAWLAKQNLMKDLMYGRSRMLILQTTDLMSRGIIDVIQQQVATCVIHYYLPTNPAYYFHRNGHDDYTKHRKTIVVNFCTDQDQTTLKRIEKFHKIKIEEMPTSLLENF